MIEVNGADVDKLAAVARKLKDAGDKDLRRELYAAINRATKPLRAQLPGSLQQHLPRRGGLAAQKARTVKYRTIRRTGARQAGIRVQAKGGQVGRLDRGELRHPVYGHKPWVTQKITAGWFTRPAEAAAPAVRADLVSALDAVAAKLDRQ